MSSSSSALTTIPSQKPLSEKEVFEIIMKQADTTLDHADPSVIAALGEYARRYASELLLDAKDYANHSGRHDISAEDLKLAIRFHDSQVQGTPSALSNVRADLINRQPLTEIPETYTYSWPADDHLLVQSHTYVPAAQAQAAIEAEATASIGIGAPVVPQEVVWSRTGINDESKKPKLDITLDTTQIPEGN